MSRAACVDSGAVRHVESVPGQVDVTSNDGLVG